MPADGWKEKGIFIRCGKEHKLVQSPFTISLAVSQKNLKVEISYYPDILLLGIYQICILYIFYNGDTFTFIVIAAVFTVVMNQLDDHQLIMLSNEMLYICRVEFYWAIKKNKMPFSGKFMGLTII